MSRSFLQQNSKLPDLHFVESGHIQEFRCAQIPGGFGPALFESDLRLNG